MNLVRRFKVAFPFESVANRLAGHGQSLMVLPDWKSDCSSKEFIEWHNNHVFAA